MNGRLWACNLITFTREIKRMILVTGGTGLVGSHLLVKLGETQPAVRAIYRKKESIEKAKRVFQALGKADYFNRIEWIEADLLDLIALQDAFEGVDYVYHSAARVSFAAKDADELMRSNIEGTANVVNVALEKGIKKLLYVSSVASLGTPNNGDCSTEETLWENTKTTSAYSVSKYYAENEVWRGAEEGLSVAIVNPTTIIGFSDWNESSSAILKKVYDGLRFYPGGSNGFIGVSDVVKAMVFFMESELENERYVLVSENLPFKALFERMAKYFNQKAPQIFVSERMAKLAYPLLKTAKFLSGKKDVISRNSISSAYRKRSYDASKAAAVLPFEFEPMDEVLKETCALYLGQLR